VVVATVVMLNILELIMEIVPNFPTRAKNTVAAMMEMDGRMIGIGRL
jgi:hypothetical protein